LLEYITQSTVSNSSGAWSLTLERTDTIAPAGMVYLVTRSMGGVIFPPVSITVPSGGGVFQDLWTSTPGPVPPGSGPTGPPGSFALEGAWSSTTPYLEGALVTYEGTLYLCSNANTDEIPTNTAYWDAAYDIWFNVASSTNDNSVGGLEMMVWLNHLGAIQPAGSLIASGVVIGGNAYNVWYGGTAPGGTVSYVLVTPVLSLSLDLAPLAADAVTRGYMLSSWYLIEVPFGFEIWQGGEGLFVQSFEVAVT
jgi:hypothetical protein